MVFQDPMTSLNPVLPIGLQLMEPLQAHIGLDKTAARLRAAELLSLVGLPNALDRLKDFPFQFSGGQRQRIMIAMALACRPSLLIADEPTTALDVTIQAQIVELIKDLQQKLGMAIIWISHNLALVAGMVDKVIVMYSGYIVEQAPVDDLYERPAHPYTMGLLQAIPTLDQRNQERLASIEGMPPDLRAPAVACPFAPRCPYVVDQCLQAVPPLQPVGANHTQPPAGVRRNCATFTTLEKSYECASCPLATAPKPSVEVENSRCISRFGAACCAGRWARCAPSMMSLSTCTKGKRWGWWVKAAAANRPPGWPC